MTLLMAFQWLWGVSALEDQLLCEQKARQVLFLMVDGEQSP